MKKRLVVMIMSLMLGAALLSGCGSDGSSATTTAQTYEASGEITELGESSFTLTTEDGETVEITVTDETEITAEISMDSMGGMGNRQGGMTGDGETMEMPEDDDFSADMEIPEDGEFSGEMPDGETMEKPDGEAGDFDGEMPEGDGEMMELPDGETMGDGEMMEMPEGDADFGGEMPDGEDFSADAEVPESGDGETMTMTFDQLIIGATVTVTYDASGNALTIVVTAMGDMSGMGSMGSMGDPEAQGAAGAQGQDADAAEAEEADEA